MNNTELYKQFYLKELSTKNDLNNAINLPMAVLTVLVSVHLYLFTKSAGVTLTLITFFSFGNFIAICFCLYFLAKSFFNFGRTYKYAEINGMDTFYTFQEQLEEKKNRR